MTEELVDDVSTSSITSFSSIILGITSLLFLHKNYCPGISLIFITWKPSRPYAISSSTPPLLLRVEGGLDWVATYLDCCGGNETMLDFILSDMLDRWYWSYMMKNNKLGKSLKKYGTGSSPLVVHPAQWSRMMGPS